MGNIHVKLYEIWTCGSDVVKTFLIWSSGSPPLQWSETIYAVLKEGIMGNIHVKSYEIWTSGSGDVVYRHFLSRALAAPLFSGLEPLVKFWKKAS